MKRMMIFIIFRDQLITPMILIGSPNSAQVQEAGSKVGEYPHASSLKNDNYSVIENTTVSINRAWQSLLK